MSAHLACRPRLPCTCVLLSNHAADCMGTLGGQATEGQECVAPGTVSSSAPWGPSSLCLEQTALLMRWWVPVTTPPPALAPLWEGWTSEQPGTLAGKQRIVSRSWKELGLIFWLRELLIVLPPRSWVGRREEMSAVSRTGQHCPGGCSQGRSAGHRNPRHSYEEGGRKTLALCRWQDALYRKPWGTHTHTAKS